MLNFITSIFKDVSPLIDKSIYTKQEIQENKLKFTELTIKQLESVDPKGQMRLIITKKITNLFIFVVFLNIILSCFTPFFSDINIILKNIEELSNGVYTNFGYILTASFAINGINTLGQKFGTKK
jgi:hypothetical protein